MSKRQLLLLTVRKVILSLIGIGVIAAMFWYVNTYIYKFYAGSAVVKIDSSSTVSNVEQGKEFKYQIVLSGQKIETADLYVRFDPTMVQYLEKIETVPANYFKLPPDYSKLSPVTGVAAQNELRLILLATPNVQTVNSIQINLTFKAIKNGTSVISFDPKTVVSGVDGSNAAVSFDEDLAKASKTITIATPPVPNKPPTISKVTWSSTNLIRGKKGSVTVTGTDPDGTKVTVFILANTKDEVDVRLAEKKDVPVTNGQWSVTLDPTMPNIVGQVSAYLAVTDGPASVKDTGTIINLANGTTDCKPVITSPTNNSVVPEELNGIKQFQLIWNKCPDMIYYRATIDGPNIPVNQLPFYFVDDTDSTTSIPRLFTIAESFEIGGKYEVRVASCTDDKCQEPIMAESEPVSFYYGGEPTENDIPPWENTDYSKTIVWGVVQSDSSATSSGTLSYWRESTDVCEGSSYPIAAGLSIDPPNTTIKNCYETESTQLPYYYIEVDNPGNNLAYSLKNVPEGYECAGWEHRLRVKSDGAVKVEKSGTGCTTGPLAITIHNATSSYNNAHFVLFKTKKSAVLPTPDEKFDTTAYMTVRFQGITELPPEPYRKLNAKVTLKKDNQEIVSKDVEFLANTDGTWTGSIGMNNISRTSKYSIFIKGAKHLSKRICTNNPSEQLSGTYVCDSDEIILNNPINILDFSNIVLLGGDIPEQDGIINALDYVFVRQNLGNTQQDNLVRADLNLDGIIDSQDNTIIITALGFKYDEE